MKFNGGRYWTRTSDPCDVKTQLRQKSKPKAEGYGTEKRFNARTLQKLTGWADDVKPKLVWDENWAACDRSVSRNWSFEPIRCSGTTVPRAGGHWPEVGGKFKCSKDSASNWMNVVAQVNRSGGTYVTEHSCLVCIRAINPLPSCSSCRAIAPPARMQFRNTKRS